MFLNAIRSRAPARPARSRAARPALEGLEDRMLLYAANGGLWTQPARITYSFVPDGTNIGGNPSAMFSSMASQGYSAAAWQYQFQKAAASWEAVSNFNLVQVADNGAAIGGPGDQQGDPNFGDIRIGGYAQSPGTLAYAFLPPPYNGATLAGDLFFNTRQAWQVDATGVDLETVAIHEIGHALGMDHSQIQAADMYAYYTTSKQTITADDSSGIQTVYGTRKPDAFDAAHSNNTAATATEISSYIDANLQIALPNLDITSTPTASDVDWYHVVVPSNTTGGMTVTMQSTNLSDLSPRVLIYNAAGTGILAQATAPGTFGATVAATLKGVTAGQSYYIRAQSAGTGALGTGAYGLLVNFGSQAQAPIAPPNTVVLAQPDQGGGASGDTLHGHHPHAHMIRVGTLRGAGENSTLAQFQSSRPRRLVRPAHAHEHGRVDASNHGGGSGRITDPARNRSSHLHAADHTLSRRV